MGLGLSEDQLKRFVGAYECPQGLGLGALNVAIKGRFLSVTSDSMLATLRATSNTDFDMIDGSYPDGWNKISFTLASDGSVIGVVLHAKDDNGNQLPDIACQRHS